MKAYFDVIQNMGFALVVLGQTAKGISKGDL